MSADAYGARHASSGDPSSGDPSSRPRRSLPASRDAGAPFPELAPPDPATAAELRRLADLYEIPAFVDVDPVSVPHAFDDPADQEIAGLFAAILAWGRRSVLLAKLAELLERMGHRPARFVHDFRPERDVARLGGFKHRTFKPEDAVALVRAIQAVRRQHGSIEALVALPPGAPHVGPAIQRLSDTLLTIVPGTPVRLRKHLARPSTGSACKRLAMYLRWMVRPGPVDLGAWRALAPHQLLIPLDVHTARQARALGVLDRRQDDWRTTLALTAACRHLDPADPARFDFALFGLGVFGGAPIPAEEPDGA